MKHQLVIALALSSTMYSQPNLQWQKTLGGDQSDFFSHVVNVGDGFSIAGSSNSGISGDKTEPSRGAVDWWLVTLDVNGNLQTQKTIGGSGNDGVGKTFSTANGNFMIAGTSDSNISGEKSQDSRGLSDFWVMKLDQTQNIIWQKTLGGNSADGLDSAIHTTDGGYLLAGPSNSGVSGEKTEPVRGLAFTYDFWIVKIDGLGNIEWQKTIGGDGNDFLRDVDQTDDGGFLLAGESASDAGFEKSENSRGNNDYWVLKLDTAGNIEWQRTLGGTANDLLTILRLTADGGCVAGGYSDSPVTFEKSEPSRGGYDYWIIKLDSEGQIEWQKTIGGTGSDILYDLIVSSDGHYILAGSSDSPISGDKTEEPRGLSDFWIVKVSQTGGIIWQKTIGGNQADTPRQIMQLDDDSLLIGGNSRSGISGEKSEICRGEVDYWIVKLEPDSLEADGFMPELVDISPNPTSEIVTIKLGSARSFEAVILDITGKVFQKSSYRDVINTQISVPSESGLYFLILNFLTGERKTFKVVKR